MKTLFISSWYPSPANACKGIFVKKHAASIKNSGADIIVFALSVNYDKKLLYQKNIFRFTDENGVLTHVIEIRSKLSKWLHVLLPLQYFVMRRYYSKNIKPVFSPDIIHSNVIYPAGIMGYWLAKREKKPSVITEHWTRVSQFLSRSIYARFGKKAYHNSTVTSVSNYLKNTLVQHGGDPDRIRIVPNTVESFFSYRKKKSHGGLVFACCASWTSHKRPDLIFTAVQKVSETIRRPITLEVIGGGPQLDKLETVQWNFHVIYHYFKEPDQVAKLFQRADYFLHASMMETFSVVVAEALAAGLPVIASNVGALSELIKPHNGVLCENTPEAWEKGIVELMQSEYDRKKISEDMKRFYPERVGDSFLEIYAKLLHVRIFGKQAA